MKIDESDYRYIKRVQDITSTDYEIIWKDAENIDGYILPENLMSMIEDLLCEIDILEEKIEYLENKEEIDYDRHTDFLIDQARGN